jgi:geranylgeranyl diphosphate synthase type II
VSDRIQILIPLRKPVGGNIPADKEQRDRLKTVCRQYANQQRLVGPLALDKLKEHALAVLEKAGLEPLCLEFAVVVLNNEIHLSALAKVPYEKRLLLLPRCLRDEKTCKGQFDELGLLCRRCGGCAIDSLTNYAGQLGYSVLVAEGSPVVMGLIEAGGIEAVVGVSCLSMLEKVFPYMETAAFPGVAVPLLYDGCAQTAFDADWLAEFLDWRDEQVGGRLDVRRLRRTVGNWFETDALIAMLGKPDGPVENAAMEWLSLAGKRWRPALAAGTWAAIQQTDVEAIPQFVRKMCIAVECFHKASLIHDDIEDGDELRYGQKTLYARLGMPIALNVGDYLIGLGYQLLAQLDVAPQVKGKIISAAAEGHRVLCLGQGAELDWTHQSKNPSVADVLKIFEQKTSPAFEVALKLGAIAAGADEALLDVLRRFSRHVGLAYQIRDDLLDWISDDRTNDMGSTRLSILKSLALEKITGSDRAVLEEIFSLATAGMDTQIRCKSIVSQYHIVKDAEVFLSEYRQKARRCVDEITDENLKGFLRIVLAKILDEWKELSCCEDHPPRDA